MLSTFVIQEMSFRCHVLAIVKAHGIHLNNGETQIYKFLSSERTSITSNTRKLGRFESQGLTEMLSVKVNALFTALERPLWLIATIKTCWSST